MLPPALGSVSGPLYCESVDLLRAGVAGEYRRAIGRDNELDVSPWTSGKRQAFQAGDFLYLLIGQSNPKGGGLLASGV